MLQRRGLAALSLATGLASRRVEAQGPDGPTTIVVPFTPGTGVDILARLILGLEANRLRLAKGARRAALTELVEARDRDEAEAIFYRRHAPVGVAAPDVAPSGTPA